MWFEKKSGFSETTEREHAHFCPRCEDAWVHFDDECEDIRGRSQPATCPLCQEG